MKYRSLYLASSLFLLTPSLLANSSTEYLVEEGDCLVKIARKKLGQSAYAPENGLSKILKINQEIKNPDRIYPGQKIYLPSEPSPSLPDSSPSPEMTELPETPAPPKLREKLSTELSLLPNYRFITIKAKDEEHGGAATLVSDYFYQLPVQWKQKWTSQFSSFQSFSFAQSAFAAPSGKELKDGSLQQMSAFAGLGFFQDKKYRMSVELGMEDQVFIKAVDLNHLQLVKVRIPQLKLISENDLLTFSDYLAGLSLEGSLLLPGSNNGISAKTGQQFAAGLYLKRPVGIFLLGLSTTYRMSRQLTNLTSQDRNEVQLGLMISVPFGI